MKVGTIEVCFERAEKFEDRCRITLSPNLLEAGISSRVHGIELMDWSFPRTIFTTIPVLTSLGYMDGVPKPIGDIITNIVIKVTRKQYSAPIQTDIINAPIWHGMQFMRPQDLQEYIQSVIQRTSLYKISVSCTVNQLNRLKFTVRNHGSSEYIGNVLFSELTILGVSIECDKQGEMGEFIMKKILGFENVVNVCKEVQNNSFVLEAANIVNLNPVTVLYIDLNIHSLRHKWSDTPGGHFAAIFLKEPLVVKTEFYGNSARSGIMPPTFVSQKDAVFSISTSGAERFSPAGVTNHFRLFDEPVPLQSMITGFTADNIRFMREGVPNQHYNHEDPYIFSPAHLVFKILFD